MVNFRSFGWVFIFALSVSLAPVWPAGAQDAADPPSMTITGTGEVRVAPDMATLRMGVEAEARLARDAVDAMRADMDTIMAVLQEAGVVAEDVQTTALGLRARREETGATPGRAPRIAGFVATSQISVVVDDLARLGDLFDAMLAAGANRIEGVSFGLKTPRVAQDAAKRAAMADARATAVLYADGAGVTLGPVLRIFDGASPRPPMSTARMMAADAAMPIAPGSLNITAQVVVTYGIGD
jgi:hypothetical protein